MYGIAKRLETSMHRGRDHGIVLVAEGVPPQPSCDAGPAHALAAFLRRYFGRLTSLFLKTEVRVSVLGHLQRGGSPTAADRILASRFAEAAWDTIAADDAPSGLLQMSGGRIRLGRFPEAKEQATMPQTDKLYALQKALSKR